MSSNKSKIFNIPLLFAAIAILLMTAHSFRNDGNGLLLNLRLRSCSNIPEIDRFMCYKEIAESIDKINGLLGTDTNVNFVSKGNKVDVSYRYFGSNCHTFYHALGDVAAMRLTPEDDLRSILSALPRECGNGALMGFNRRYVLENRFSKEAITAVYSNCPRALEEHCAHEVGHNLEEKVSSSSILDYLEARYARVSRQPELKTTLDTDYDAPRRECMAILPDAAQDACISGTEHNIFMKYDILDIPYTTAVEKCIEYSKQFEADCLTRFAEKSGQSAALALLAGDNSSDARKVCESSMLQRPSLISQCYFGFGYMLGAYEEKEGNKDKLLGLCAAIGGNYMLDCESGLQTYRANLNEQ